MATTIIAGLALATSVAGIGVGSANAQSANTQQAGIARSNQQNAQNEQHYQQALNAIGMRRAVAGTTDGRGNSTVYDPSTNSWKTNLSLQGQRLQTASDQAAISRDTTDLATGQEANKNAMADAIKAREASGPALAAIRNYNPLTSQGMEGALQETATTANRQAQDPIIADTLRSFARTGTAAGPVLTNMMRDNATSLRQTMLGNKIESMKNTSDINARNLASLGANYANLNAAAKPALNFSPISQGSPNDALVQAMNARAGASSSPASQGAYSLLSVLTLQTVLISLHLCTLAQTTPGQDLVR